MKRLSWKYIAGLIDGEGCIDLQITRIKDREGYYIIPRVRVALAESSVCVLELFKNNFGGNLILSEKSRLNENWQNAISWELCGYRQACKFLRNIVNSLILKKEQARLCLWMETNVKGEPVSQPVKDVLREEFKAMKRDPHRLSDGAQNRILSVL